MMNDELRIPQFELRPTEVATPLTFSEGGRRFRVSHVFRAPDFADWLEYEQKMARSVEIVSGATKFDRREAEAAEALWDRIALRVEGYRVQVQSSKFKVQKTARKPQASSLKPQA